MTAYYIIFSNSLFSSLILSLRSEYAWFIAQEFGGHNMWLATLAAVAGSALGMSANFGLGYYCFRMRTQWMHFSDAAYDRISGYMRRYGVWVLLLPSFTFAPLVALIVGLFRVPFRKAVMIMVAGRLGYYGYYAVVKYFSAFA